MSRHFGHTKIRYQQVGLFSLYDVESFGPGIRAERLVTSPLQKLAHGTSHLGLVVNHQYCCRIVTHLHAMRGIRLPSGLSVHVCHRYCDRKPCPGGTVLVAYIPSMITHYRLAYRQAHPGTLARRLGREKWVE